MDHARAVVNSVTEKVFPGFTYQYVEREKSNEEILTLGQPVNSNLALQMALYFNVIYTPCWILGVVSSLIIKYEHLNGIYRFLLITAITASIVVEVIRLFLGYWGNLEEKVPQLAGFWLLTLLMQTPLTLFLLLNKGGMTQSWEIPVIGILLYMLLFQVVLGLFVIRKITKVQARIFLQHSLLTAEQ